MSEMTCYVCSQSDFHKLEGYHSKSTLLICKGCGNLMHQLDDARKKSLLDYYRRDYRNMPNAMELLTKHNKIAYIRRWLEKWAVERKAEAASKGTQGPLGADIGAATGYVLSFLKQVGWRVRGTEWDVLRRRFSEHYYGIPLEEELNRKEPYDLLILYHTLEHIVEPDKKLAEYASALKDDGRFLVSTPYWLETLEEQSGGALQTFDHLYHLNHINLFSKTSIQNLFRNAGLEWEWLDDTTYGQTYLLKKGQKTPIVKEDYKQVAELVQRQRQAMEVYHQRKFKKAIDLWPNFPEAWLMLIFQTYGKDPSRQQDMIESLDPNLKRHFRIQVAIAQWLTQMDRLDDAEKAWAIAFNTRPHAHALNERAKALVRLGRPLESLPLFNQAAQWDPRNWMECQDWMAKAACSVPTWDERAQMQMRDALVKQAEQEGRLKVEINHENGNADADGKREAEQVQASGV